MSLHEELRALTQQDIAAILCERRGHVDHPHGCTATINLALTVIDFRNAVLARHPEPAVSDTTQPEGENTMSTIDNNKWARAKEDVLGRVSAAFDLLAPVAEVGNAWEVAFKGKLEIQDASLESAIGINYRTDVFSDERLPDDGDE